MPALFTKFEHLFSAERLEAFLFYLDMFNDLAIKNEWMLRLLQVFLDRLVEPHEILISSISMVYATTLLMGAPQQQLEIGLELCYQNENFPRRDFFKLLTYVYSFLASLDVIDVFLFFFFSKTLTIYATRLSDHTGLLRLIELEGIVHLLKSVDSATKGYSKEVIPGRCAICALPITESFMVTQDNAIVTHTECFKNLQNS